MSEFPKFKNSPIIEAVIDFDCDLPALFQIEAVRDCVSSVYKGDYPNLKQRWLQEHRISGSGGDGAMPAPKKEMDAWIFQNDERKQLIQIRRNGFSFNKLQPYTELDDYLPEVKKRWGQYCGMIKPLSVQTLRLRFINRIAIPHNGAGTLELSDYLANSPKLPDECGLSFKRFLNQYQAIEKASGSIINSTLASQGVTATHLLLIFSIEVSQKKIIDPSDWDSIELTINDLRRLKNNIFFKTISEKCKLLFQN